MTGAEHFAEAVRLLAEADQHAYHSHAALEFSMAAPKNRLAAIHAVLAASQPGSVAHDEADRLLERAGQLVPADLGHAEHLDSAEVWARLAVV